MAIKYKPEDHVLFDPPVDSTATDVSAKDSTVTFSTRRESRSNAMIRRKKIACLGLAASIVVPNGLATFSQLYADQSAGAGSSNSQARPTNADLLKLGVDQYN